MDGVENLTVLESANRLEGILGNLTLSKTRALSYLVEVRFKTKYGDAFVGYYKIQNDLPKMPRNVRK